MQAVMFSLHHLQNEVVDDKPKHLREERRKQLSLIKEVLEESSLETAMAKVSRWCSSLNGNKGGRLSIGAMPSVIVRECCRAFGLETYPDLPVVRRFNYGELSKHIDKIEESDRFISTIGVSKLSNDELKTACVERYVELCLLFLI
jgi:hypothetical protein